MKAGDPSLRLASFGAFELDLQSGQLRKHGLRVKLQEQPFQILKLLVERPGELVTREELRRRLWPADTFVDFENGLNAAVKRLRYTLADDKDEPRFVETVPRRGYRFIAPLHTKLAASRRIRSPLVLAAVVVVGLVVLGTFTWRLTHSRGQLPAGRLMLAVLPFENLTGDPNQEYFSDGLTEEMITQLGRIQPERLGVIARTSVMPYKRGHRRVDVIGRDLGVQYVLEGSLRQTSGRVRVTAQLIQVKDQAHIWAEEYDRELRDVLALQGEVARTIADQIQIKLSAQQRARLANPRPVDPVAHELYLKGRYFWNKRTSEGFKKAIEYSQQAIERDPTYARAYAGLADAYLLLGGYGAASQAETIPKAKAAARKALQIDDTLAEPDTSLGLIAENYDWDWAEAGRQYKRAIELNPNYATAHHWYAEYLAPLGRFEEAIAEIKRARELDPLSLIISADLGKILYYARQHDRAIEQLRKTLEMDPNFVPAHYWLASSYAQKGMFREAIADLKTVERLDDTKGTLATLGMVYGLSGQREKAQEVLAELKRLAGQRYIDPFCMVEVYVGLGANGQAFAWLENEYAAHSVGLTSLKVNPVYDSLRSDPRFQDLVRRVGLPP